MLGPGQYPTRRLLRRAGDVGLTKEALLYQTLPAGISTKSPAPGSYWIFNLKMIPSPRLRPCLSPCSIGIIWRQLSMARPSCSMSTARRASPRAASPAYLADHGANGQAGESRQNVGFLPFNGGVDEIAFYTPTRCTVADVLADYQVCAQPFRAVSSSRDRAFCSNPPLEPLFAVTLVTFTVTANGTTPLSYQWKRGDAPLLGATNSTYSFTVPIRRTTRRVSLVTVTMLSARRTATLSRYGLDQPGDFATEPFGPITCDLGSKAAFRVVANGA